MNMSSRLAVANTASVLKTRAKSEKEKKLMRELFKMADENKVGKYI